MQCRPQKKPDADDSCASFSHNPQRNAKEESLQMNNTPGTAPNFKTACLVLFGVNITWILFAVWAIWGLVAVAVTGWCVNRVIALLAARAD
jgi:hypothetical protein